jgi:hypothetical protein
MNTAVATTLDELRQANGKYDILYVVDLKLPHEVISANSVKLVRCSGDNVCIDAQYLQVEGGYFYELFTRGPESRVLTAAIKRFVATEPARDVTFHMSAVNFLTLGDVHALNITSSWVGSVIARNVVFAMVSGSYVGSAYSRDQKPFLFAAQAAVTNTNWPVADAQARVPGGRVNVFKGRTSNGIPLKVPTGIETGVETTLVSVGWDAVLSFDEAVVEYGGRPGVRETLERTLRLMEENSKTHFE